MTPDQLVKAVAILRQVEHGGFARDSACAQCPSCGKYSPGATDTYQHETDCGLAWLIRQMEKE